MALKQKCNNPFVDYRNSGTGFHVGLKMIYVINPCLKLSVSGLSPRTGEQPDDKTEERKHQNEYDPEDLRPRGNRALKDIDYSPNVKYKDKQSKKSAESEHINPPLEFKNIASFNKSQQVESSKVRK